MHTLKQTMDQAAGLRRMACPKPVQVIAVTSGKGGVGKTNVSVNLAAALAQRSHEVLLMDADLGLANVDILLGLQPKHNLSHVINGSCSIEDIILRGPNGMKVVPSSSGTKRMVELNIAEHAGIIQAFGQLTQALDVLIVDTAAGICESVVRFTQASQHVVVVVCDEPTSITDAYALIKILSRDYDIRRFHILANMTRSPHEGRELFNKLARVADRFLDVTLDYFGTVPYDDYLRKAVRKQCAVIEAYPECWSATTFKSLAGKVEKWPDPQAARGHIEFFMERLIGTPVDAGGVR